MTSKQEIIDNVICRYRASAVVDTDCEVNGCAIRGA
jgi:hypothetical protein